MMKRKRMIEEGVAGGTGREKKEKEGQCFQRTKITSEISCEDNGEERGGGH